MVPGRGHTYSAACRCHHRERTSRCSYRRCCNLLRSDRRPGSANSGHSSGFTCPRAQKARGQDHLEWLRDQFESTGTIAATRRPKLPGCSSAIRNMQRMPNCCFRPLPSTWISVLRFSACSPNRGRCLGFRAGRISSNLFLICAGEPAENVLARFKSPSTVYQRARSLESAQPSRCIDA